MNQNNFSIIVLSSDDLSLSNGDNDDYLPDLVDEVEVEPDCNEIR